jgi:hypothetical protein
VTTQKQIEANRRNSANSTGARSESGKRRSSRNATKHGLSSSRFAFLDFESVEEYRALLKAFTEHYQPVGPVESKYVEQIVQDWFRSGRFPVFEAGILASEYATAETLGLGLNPDQFVARMRSSELGSEEAEHSTNPQDNWKNSNSDVGTADTLAIQVWGKAYSLSASKLALLSRYEGTIDRRISRKISELEALQERRKREEAIVVEACEEVN